MLQPGRGLPRALWIRERGGIVMLALLAWALPTMAWGGSKVPVGSEFQVNTYTTGEQGGYREADVASDAAGNFVVVWQRADGYGAVGQRFSSEGVPQGGEFFVNSAPDGYDEYEAAARPEVASDAAGNFVVVWESYDCDGTEGVCAQRFNSAGAAQGAEFKVSPAGYHYAHNPKIASDAAGNFVIVWVMDWPPSIFGRRFDSTGTALDPTEFQVNTYTTYCCGFSADESNDYVEIASDSAGNFVVVWNRYDGGAWGRAFDSAGVPAGPDFDVHSGSDPSAVAVAADGLGRFVTVWNGYYSGAPILGRHFDSTGTPIGAEFEIKGPTDSYSLHPKVAADAAGNFVVVWDDADCGVGSTSYGVCGRQFDSTGTPLGSTFEVNTWTSGGLRGPAVASADSGNFVVVWRSMYDQDGYGSGIFGQRFAESGSTTTTTTPATTSTTTTTLPPGCTPTPKGNCRRQTRGRSGGFSLKDKSPDSKDRLKWKWARGNQTDLEDFGDPLGDGTDYLLCVYDESANQQPISEHLVGSGGMCPGRPCWRQVGAKRFDYRNHKASDNYLKVFLKAAEEGRARIGVTGRGIDLDIPQLPLEAPVTVQFQASNGECWGERYNTFIRKNEEGAFRAKPDGPVPTTTSTTTTATLPTTTTTLRFVDNGDGTITDSQTGLMWEKKDDNNSGGIHDMDNLYTWSTGPPYNPDGTAFTVFLSTLNDTCDGDELTPCTTNGDCTGIGNGLCGHAGYRDWRLPSEGGCNACYTGSPTYSCPCDPAELETILLEPYPCWTRPCVDPVFDTGCTGGCTVTTCSCTALSSYWSSTTDAVRPGPAWYVYFGTGYVGTYFKFNGESVRAVRGGS